MRKMLTFGNNHFIFLHKGTNNEGVIVTDRNFGTQPLREIITLTYSTAGTFSYVIPMDKLFMSFEIYGAGGRAGYLSGKTYGGGGGGGATGLSLPGNVAMLNSGNAGGGSSVTYSNPRGSGGGGSGAGGAAGRAGDYGYSRDGEIIRAGTASGGAASTANRTGIFASSVYTNTGGMAGAAASGTAIGGWSRGDGSAGGKIIQPAINIIPYRGEALSITVGSGASTGRIIIKLW